MEKEENERYTYTMFNEVLPLALSLSSMHTKVAPNLHKEFRIHKREMSFRRIINHSN